MEEYTVRLYMKVKKESDWAKFMNCRPEEYDIPFTSHELFRGDDGTPTERLVSFIAKWDCICRFIESFRYRFNSSHLFIIACHTKDGDCCCTSRETCEDEVDQYDVIRFNTNHPDSVFLPNIQSIFEEGDVDLSEAQKVYLAGFDGENFAFVRESMTNVNGMLIQGDTVMCCVENIGSHVTVPNGIRRIRQYAFSQTKIENVELPETLIQICRSAFEGCSTLKEIVLPSSVKEIGDSAFEGCSTLKEITLPPSVKEIGKSAFLGCRALKVIMLPPSVEEIGKSAFKDCWSLEEITLPPSLKRISDSAFYYCTKLKEITLPPSVKNIGESVFKNCRSLEEITLPPSMVSIGKETFENCNALEEITLPPSVKKIGESAFKDCRSLEEITLPPSVKRIGSSAFWGCGALKEVTLSSSLVSIGGSAFWGCRSLEEITLPSSLVSIGASAFRECSALKEITFPSSVKSIYSYAFSDCSALKEITLPPSLEKLGGHAFCDCNSLARACFPARVGLSGNIFSGCYVLEKICLLGGPNDETLIGGELPKGVKSIEAPYVPYISFSKKFQRLAAIGFIEAYMRGDSVKEELKDEYFESIRLRGHFSQYLDRPLIIRFLIQEKMIKLYQVDKLTEESGRSGNVEVTAMLMDYKHSAFSEKEIQKADLRKQRRSEKELEKLLEL